MASFYYDTNMVVYFLGNVNQSHPYWPKNSRISIFTKEELLNSVIHNHIQIDLFTLWQSFETIIKPLFLPNKKEIGIQILDTHLSDLIGTLIANNINVKRAPNKKKPDGMDWLHLAMADLLDCNTFVTADTGFLELKALKGKFTFFKSLDNVIILDVKNNMAKLEEFSLH